MWCIVVSQAGAHVAICVWPLCASSPQQLKPALTNCVGSDSWTASSCGRRNNLVPSKSGRHKTVIGSTLHNCNGEAWLKLGEVHVHFSVLRQSADRLSTTPRWHAAQEEAVPHTCTGVDLPTDTSPSAAVDAIA